IAEQLRDAAAPGFRYPVLLQAQINVSFPAIVRLALMHLDGKPHGSSSGFDLAFHDKDDTMNTEAELIAEGQSVSFSECSCSAKQLLSVCHGCRKPEASGSFSRR